MNFALSLLMAPVWAVVAVWWWEALRNPRRRVWREDRESMRTHARMRKALR